MDAGSGDGHALLADEAEVAVPMGSISGVLECAAGASVHYYEALCETRGLAVEGLGREKVCFDYAVVLSGKVEQYKAPGQSGGFPTTVKSGGFLSEHATLHNSWRDPCRIALVRLDSRPRS